MLLHRWANEDDVAGFQRSSVLVYQTMLEVMKHQYANGYRTYIVTDDGEGFVGVQTKLY